MCPCHFISNDAMEGMNRYVGSLNFFANQLRRTLNTHHAIYIVIDTIHPLANQSCYLQNGQLIMTLQSVSIALREEEGVWHPMSTKAALNVY